MKKKHLVIGLSARTTEDTENNVGFTYTTTIPMANVVEFLNPKNPRTLDGIGFGMKAFDSGELTDNIPYYEQINNIVPFLSRVNDSTDKTQLANSYKLQFKSTAGEVIHTTEDATDKLKKNHFESLPFVIYNRPEMRKSLNLTVVHKTDKPNSYSLGIPYTDTKGKPQFMHLLFTICCLEGEMTNQNDSPKFDTKQLNTFVNSATIDSSNKIAHLINNYIIALGSTPTPETKQGILNMVLNIADSKANPDMMSQVLTNLNNNEYFTANGCESFMQKIKGRTDDNYYKELKLSYDNANEAQR